MKKYFSLLILLASIIFVSCEDEKEMFLAESLNEDLTGIQFIVEDFDYEDGGRISVTPQAHFTWEEGDKLGVFPLNGKQTEFIISTGAGANSAMFNGGEWSLRPTTQYAAYYPLVEQFNLNKSCITINYSGQKQDGNGSTDHLGDYDFLASTFVSTNESGFCNFSMKHLGCLVRIVLTMPDADTYSQLRFETPTGGIPYIFTYGLGEDVVSLTTTESAEFGYLGLTNVSTTAANQTITLYMMAPPRNLLGENVTLTVIGAKRTYSATIAGKNMIAGKAYALSATCQNAIPYLTFHAAQESTLQLNKSVTSLQYSLNGGTWTTLGTSKITFGGSHGDLQLRGKSSTGTGDAQFTLSQTCDIRCSGDIRTLVDYENYTSCNCSSATFKNLFKNCTSLTSCPDLPATLLAEWCYSQMFSGCTSLKVAPSLPATQLVDYCYYYMFNGCKSLTSTPVLSSKQLADYCYYGMFAGCTSLADAPELPATQLYAGCYYYMFKGCTSLAVAPELPAFQMQRSCYEGMFHGCKSLTSAPQLPATQLANNCYYGMFNGCTSLVKAPALPATQLANNCYYNLFSGCSALTVAPSLPATQLADWCYGRMFANCTSLISAPILPATQLAGSCYQYMFYGCTSLSVASSLPATQLANGCYQYMFWRCTSLSLAPALPATELVTSCYSNMFRSCTSLNYVVMNAETLADKSVTDFLNGVSSTGTFVKNPNATWSNSDCVPTGWNVTYLN